MWSAHVKSGPKHGGEIHPRGLTLAGNTSAGEGNNLSWDQTHKPIVAKRKCANERSLAQSVSPSKLHQTLPVYVQLIYLMLYNVCQ